MTFRDITLNTAVTAIWDRILQVCAVNTTIVDECDVDSIDPTDPIAAVDDSAAAPPLAVPHTVASVLVLAVTMTWFAQA